MATSARLLVRSGSTALAAFAFAVLASPAVLHAQDPDSLMKECMQEDVASFAVRACTRLLADDTLPPNERVRLHLRRAAAWLVEDDPEAAAEDFTHALDGDPANAIAIAGRAGAYDLFGRFDLAVTDWSALIARTPKDDGLYRKRGSSYLGAKQYAQALADHSTSLEINPSALDAYIGRALVYEAMNDRPKALAEFDRAAALNPQYLPLYWERARMADRWGERELAIQNYINVLKINGHFANARKHLERLGVYSPY